MSAAYQRPPVTQKEFVLDRLESWKKRMWLAGWWTENDQEALDEAKRMLEEA